MVSINEHRFCDLFHSAAIGIAYVGLTGQWLQVNQKICDLVGYTQQELLERTFQDITHPEDLDTDLEYMQRLLTLEIQTYSIEKRYIHKNGSYIWIYLTVVLVRSPRGEPEYFITVIKDISDRKQAQEKLKLLAYYDVLTGLPNRFKFLEYLHQCIESSNVNPNYLFSVVYLSLNQYQVIKYSLGHSQSDKLLIEMVRRCLSFLTPNQVLARVGENEFAILIRGESNFENVANLANRLRKQVMRSPFKLNSPFESFTLDIGIVNSTIGYNLPEDFLRAADTAMHYAKLQGRDSTIVFEKAMQQRAIERLQLENDLQQAIKSQQLYLSYQPIISLKTGLIAGFEALLRWRHPTKGTVLPTEFIPLAEETGLIVPITQWVLETASRQLSLWQKEFFNQSSLSISVNLSGIQLTQPNLLEFIDKLLLKVGLKGDNLKLEITESMLVDSTRQVSVILEQLQARNIQLSLDDFGTGYSCFSYLHSLPVDNLKIDRSFVNQIIGNQKKSGIVRAIITLARDLELKVIAEGVETRGQLDILRDLGCDYAQGYFFSKPLETKAVDTFLRNHLGKKAEGRRQKVTECRLG
ncbi:EAL domain-containing protein [Scytonema sp. UIC 10036]|uniref:putative bifunctional diguanylate cyclase/phosphodiesterase n=1 Tax=Scytonema sp. UIC 10036 TaxID=2304196 RepID=UPI0012DA12D0|nr:GGDEF domain-containing phosphodiesterase [Scytonema sp. UIC 10036]MUG99880.1 EAL domain-containing protein [Scytonema sp. UIC 10036]